MRSWLLTLGFVVCLAESEAAVEYDITRRIERIRINADGNGSGPGESFSPSCDLSITR